MTKDPEKLYVSPGDELLDLMQDIRDELRQIRKFSEHQHYQLIQIDSIKATISDAAKDVTSSIDFLQKELIAKLEPLSQLAKILQQDQYLAKDMATLIEDSVLQLGRKLDDISKTLDERDSE